jgi:hypothetical protein
LSNICLLYSLRPAPQAAALSTLVAATGLAPSPAPSTAIALAAALVVPTVLLPDVAALSALGALNAFAAAALAVVLVSLLLLSGGVGGGAATAPIQALVPATLPKVLGLVAFVYAGHSTFPVVRASMARPAAAPAVLVAAYCCVAVACAIVGGAGYALYGACVRFERKGAHTCSKHIAYTHTTPPPPHSLLNKQTKARASPRSSLQACRPARPPRPRASRSPPSAPLPRLR